MKLIIVRGLPGSGKSTLALKLVADAQRNLKDIIRLEADLFHTMSDGEYVYRNGLAGYAHQFCQSTTAFYLNKGTDVVVANTFVNKEECLPYFKIAKLLSADMEIIVCTGEYDNVHDVPKNAIQSMTDRWEDFSIGDLCEYYEEREALVSKPPLDRPVDAPKKGFFARLFL
jgi:predicted kinase